jgi:hypothetical protein
MKNISLSLSHTLTHTHTHIVSEGKNVLYIASNVKFAVKPDTLSSNHTSNNPTRYYAKPEATCTVLGS